MRDSMMLYCCTGYPLSLHERNPFGENSPYGKNPMKDISELVRYEDIQGHTGH